MSGVFGGTIFTQLTRICKVRQTGNYQQLLNGNDNENEQQHAGDEHQQTEMGEIDRQNRNQKGSWFKVLRAALYRPWSNKEFRIAATSTALFLQIIGVAGIFILLHILESNFRNNYRVLLISISIVIVLLSITWCSPIQKYLNTPQRIPADGRAMASARWKNGILTNLWRILSLPVVAIIMSVIPSADLNVDVDYLGKGLAQLGDLSGYPYFLVNICCTLGAYLLSLFACTIRKCTIGFVLPILLATPVAVCTTLGICAIDHLKSALACDGIQNSNEYGLLFLFLIFLWLSQIIYGVFYMRRKHLISWIKEDVFIQLYYNCPFTDQSLMLNIKTDFDDEEVEDHLNDASHVFFCTTMYREKLREQNQLLQSIHDIDDGQERYRSRNFEWHVFFDGGAKDCHTTEFANQLFSLLNDTLNIKLSDGEKCKTPYGLQIKWNLPGGMPFYVHLKDPTKVKKKKRWSKVMYLSYILDFRCPKSIGRDDNTFVFMTDGDIVFDREAVEIVLDRLCRDQLVGGVCGRVHPLGSGPIVWYQKFDYAVGHWFQKVAEHVLGSVVCCQRCFSVFRARALRAALPEYTTKVETAKDFLTKDMGEDRWLCRLMVDAGWRLEYAAAANIYTFCPDSFDEFYKQRRRWTLSTMANLIELCSNAAKVIRNNHAVSIIYILYQAAMIFSTLVAPATVILVMAAGMTYAFNTSSDYTSGAYIAFLVLFILVSFIYGVVCILCRPDTQLRMAKILTFIFSILMGMVAVGVIVQIVSRREGQEAPTTSHLNSLSPTKANSGISLEGESIITWYLSGLSLIFVVAAFLHPTEFFCLFHSLWYLLCLPSGYLFHIIYSICNLNDDSWGTRETAKQNTEGQSMWSFVQYFVDKLKEVCGCCDCCHSSITAEPSTPELRSVKVQTIPITVDETVAQNSLSVEVQTTSGTPEDDDENITKTNSDLPLRVDQTEGEDRASTRGKSFQFHI